MTYSKTPWLRYWKPQPEAKLRLFCLAYAGGGASVFRPWAEKLPSKIELFAIQLPGRENRLAEDLFTDLNHLADILVEVLLPELNKPFALFGHSLGALIAFELSRRLEQRHDLSPVHLFVSGRRAPQLPDLDEPVYVLPDAAFLAQVRQKYGGIPDALLEDEELLELFLPMLRADFILAEAHIYQAQAPLKTPITALGGQDDVTVPHADLEPWRVQTQQAFAQHIIPGDHFYLKDSLHILQRIIMEATLDDTA